MFGAKVKQIGRGVLEKKYIYRAENNIMEGTGAMKRRDFLASISLLAASSCSRKESRHVRYDEHECPFCTGKKGVCTYCKGTRKCAFCKGVGVRKTVADDRGNDKIRKTVYTEGCAYCGGKGTCHYCSGKGTCWACDGTGRIESWNFFSKARKIDSLHRQDVK